MGTVLYCTVLYCTVLYCTVPDIHAVLYDLAAGLGGGEPGHHGALLAVHHHLDAARGPGH